jgi:hypothetical protein
MVMENEVHTCSKCSKIIPFGQKYFSIVISLEHLVKETPKSEPQIEVKEANEVVSFCEDCGNCFNKDNFAEILIALANWKQDSKD